MERDGSTGRIISINKPCGYVMNNPLMFTDPDGRYITFFDRGTEYRYTSTGVQHQVNGQWTTIDSSVEFSDFAISIVTSLIQLENGGSVGSGLVGYFDNIKNNIKIEQTSDGNYYKDGVAYINTTNTFQTYTVNGLENTPLFIALGHEMAHGMDPQKNPDYFYPWVKGKTKEQDISNSEKYASHIENKIRAEWNLSLRASYALTEKNGLDIKTMLVDKFGYSTYFDRRGNKLPGISGNDKSNAYDSIIRNTNTKLLDRYNYYENRKQPNFLRLFLLWNYKYSIPK